jgi:hypothetical protein
MLKSLVHEFAIIACCRFTHRTSQFSGQYSWEYRHEQRLSWLRILAASFSPITKCQDDVSWATSFPVPLFTNVPAIRRYTNVDLDSNKNKTKQKTPWSESASELYRSSDRRMSAKLVPTFAVRRCNMVSVTDPYGRIFNFLDRRCTRSFCISLWRRKPFDGSSYAKEIHSNV